MRKMSEIIKIIKDNYCKCADLFLTESDCHYYVREIIENKFEETDTLEDSHNILIKSSIIRSELSWFDKNSEDRKLTIRPDLTIINRNNLTLYNPKGFNISKGIFV